MTYLRKLDNVLYDFTLKTDPQKIIAIVPDLLTRVSTFTDMQSWLLLTDDYLVSDKETPEIVAYNVYGNMELHWVVLYFNRITDLQSQWPRPDEAVKKFAEEKYGDSNIHNVHHYKTIEGYVADFDWIEENFGAGKAIQITNLDHEISLNESKRLIKILRPQFLTAFIQKIEEKLK
jgi:hypothetical protein